MTTLSTLTTPADSRAVAGPAPGGERFHHIDALRGLLMVLGVVLHAALIYMSGSDWVVSDPGQSAVFGYVYEGIHAFRMPAFFVISGLLTERMLRKGAGRFVRDRFVRLGVPLLTTAIVLNAVQTYLVYGPEVGLAGAWAVYVDGRWVGHLWFIVYLLVYGCVAAGVRAIVGDRLSGAMPLFAGAVIGVMPAVSGGLRWVGDTYLSADALTHGMLDVRDLIGYATFFAFGLVYRPGADPDALRRLAIWSVPLLAFSIASPLDHVDGMSLYADAGVAWSTSVLCLYIGLKLLARPSAIVRRLADASYTVYLVHHLAVVALGLALVSVPAPSGVKFALVVAGAVALSLGVHERGVRKSPTLAFLLNGQRKRPAAVAEPVVVEARVPSADRLWSGVSTDTTPTSPGKGTVGGTSRRNGAGC